MREYLIDSAEYEETKVGGTIEYKKKVRGELQVTTDKDNQKVLEACEGKDGYKSLGTIKDAPGIWIDDMKVPEQKLKENGKKAGTWLAYRVEANLELKTYVVSQCEKCEASRCRWYPRLMVPWSVQIDTTIKRFADMCKQKDRLKELHSLCKSDDNRRGNVDWDLPNASSFVEPRPAQTFNDPCDILQENMNMADCDNPSRWCNPYVRNWTNWTREITFI